MCGKIDRAIEYVEAELESYRNPGSYNEPEYYAHCASKVDAFEDVLSMLQKLKKEGSE